MKILILTTRFYPHVGGVENVVENLANNFKDRNEVCVLTSKSATKFVDIEDPIEDKGGYKIKRIWLAFPRSIFGFLAFPVRFLLSVNCLKSFVKNFEPRVINIHFLDDISIYAYFLLLGGVNSKVVINIHGNDLQVFAKNPFYRIFIKKVLHRSDKIIVNSKYMLDEMLSFDEELKNKVQTIPNGLEVEVIKNIATKKYFKEDYIFFVGRFVYKKGIDILLKAFLQAQTKIPDIKLLLEGKGEVLSEIKKFISNNKLEDKIVLTEGSLNSEDKFSYMKGSIFGVIPSRVEPFGIVALEFLAAGVPVIASKTGGLVDLIEEGKTGLFFENENFEELSNLIIKLKNDEGLRKEISSNQFEAIKKYEWKKVSGLYLNLFESLN